MNSVADRAVEQSLRGTRGAVLDLLRLARGPLDVQEVAGRTGLHLNTARFHLDKLVQEGLAVKGASHRGGRGRPRAVYSALHLRNASGNRSYRFLAEALASMVSGMMPDPEQAAVEAGRAWGGYLSEAPPPFQQVTAAEARRRLRELLTGLGFAVEGGDDGDLRLRHCPYRDVARLHCDVVCSLHRGLVEGALSHMRAPIEVRLDPFIEPAMCVIRLHASSSGLNGHEAS